MEASLREKMEKKARREKTRREKEELKAARKAHKVKRKLEDVEDALRQDPTLDKLRMSDQRIAELLVPIGYERSPKSASRSASKSASKSAETRKSSTPNPDNQYKIMQVQLKDRQGNLFTIERRVRSAHSFLFVMISRHFLFSYYYYYFAPTRHIDPSVPTYVKIPTGPLPRAWGHTIVPLVEPGSLPPATKVLLTDSILGYNLFSLGQDFQAIYMDPPLLLPNEPPLPGKFTIDKLVCLHLFFIHHDFRQHGLLSTL